MRLYLRRFDRSVLMAIEILPRPTALGIRDYIGAGRIWRFPPSLGAMYGALERLENKGLIGAEWNSDNLAARGGHRERIYHIIDHQTP